MPRSAILRHRGSLSRWLFDKQLVDELTLLTVPVIVGPGTRLFPDTGPDTALDPRATPKGVRSRSTGPPGALSTERLRST